MSVGSWIVAVTKAQRENWAADNVRRQGFECYLPFTEAPRLSRKPKECLFPRYLFVLTEGPWRFLLGTYGVVDLVWQGGKPAVLPAKTVTDLKAREDQQGLIRLPDKADFRFNDGDKVRVSEGPFSGYIGVYSCDPAHERVKVLLEFLGRQATVSIQDECLEHA